MIAINCLASSSRGNCYLLSIINGPHSTNIMVECGIPLKEIISKLLITGQNINSLNAVLVTHNHQDHAKSIRDLQERGKRVYASKETLGVENDYTLHPGEVKAIASGVVIIPFPVEHDCSGSLGFIIKAEDEYLLFVNDCKYIKYDLSQYKFNYVMIECNYDSQIVHIAYNQAKNENSSEQYRYKRLLDSHMSNTNCLRTLRTFDLAQCKGIFLMHLSDGNSNEQKFRNDIKKETKIPTFICGKYGGIT